MPADYKFTNAFPYLLTRAGVRMGEVFASELVGSGITLHMYRVLAALREHDSQRLIDLAEMVSSEISTLSRLVSTLIELKYVTRKRLKTDGRTVRISLTPSGRELVERWMPCAIHFEELATRGFSEDEVELLKGMLIRVFENLKEEVSQETDDSKTANARGSFRTRLPMRSQRSG